MNIVTRFNHEFGAPSYLTARGQFSLHLDNAVRLTFDEALASLERHDGASIIASIDAVAYDRRAVALSLAAREVR